MQPNSSSRLDSSFRDPSGFMFRHEGTLYRQVNQACRETYDQLMGSGLYEALLKKGWIIPHREVAEPIAEPETAYRVLQPEPLIFVSYPYEWSFGQLKDAALRTLDIQLLALDHGMILKDASAYNIQFHEGRPLLIDTLSFDIYREGSIWEGYRQFCEHFLSPLTLIAKTDIRLNQLSRVYIDGIPLDLASSLLGPATRLSPGILMHLHLHARAQSAYAGSDYSGSLKPRAPRPLSRRGLTGIVTSLRNLIRKLDWQPAGTEWVDYYQATNYSDEAFQAKNRQIQRLLKAIQPTQVWDLGANTGVFSRLASEMAIPTVAFDIDPAAVEINYRRVKAERETRLLPLVMDLTNPSTGLGWAGRERDALVERGPVDCALALALIHHLAISNNVPLGRIAAFFACICRHLIIEFVPKSDSQVKRLLRSRRDIFDDYHEAGFEAAFEPYFTLEETCPLEGSERTLCWMQKRP